MATLSIVEHFDVLKQIGPGGLSRSVSNPVYALALEDTEEAFDNGVVVTIAGAAHAAVNTVLGEFVTKVIA